ncbi:MAG: hypothetical protein M3Y03_02055 [Verrucomicrobiota bacterium]|nr:hypothetical protein [Verrucomicrobiota bacterium]
MNTLLSTGKILAIQLFFLTTFLLAALIKWSAGVTPGFLQQFGATWLARLPGGLPAVYFFLATMETIVVLGFAASLLTGEFLVGKAKPLLKLALVLSLFIFIVLAFGSRLTAKFDVAAINLLYFLGALLCFQEAERAERSTGPL